MQNSKKDFPVKAQPLKAVGGRIRKQGIVYGVQTTWCNESHKQLNHKNKLDIEGNFTFHWSANPNGLQQNTSVMLPIIARHQSRSQNKLITQ